MAKMVEISEVKRVMNRKGKKVAVKVVVTFDHRLDITFWRTKDGFKEVCRDSWGGGQWIPDQWYAKVVKQLATIFAENRS